jgi:DNA-binding transcriptional ArsR family regulator/predicted  nucleic acid-binding Zn-ribbon protein
VSPRGTGETKQAILDVIGRLGPCTPTEIVKELAAQELDVAKSTAQNHLEDLLEAGAIKAPATRQGSGKAQRLYELAGTGKWQVEDQSPILSAMKAIGKATTSKAIAFRLGRDASHVGTRLRQMERETGRVRRTGQMIHQAGGPPLVEWELVPEGEEAQAKEGAMSDGMVTARVEVDDQASEALRDLSAKCERLQARLADVAGVVDGEPDANPVPAVRALVKERDTLKQRLERSLAAERDAVEADGELVEARQRITDLERHNAELVAGAEAVSTGASQRIAALQQELGGVRAERARLASGVREAAESLTALRRDFADRLGVDPESYPEDASLDDRIRERIAVLRAQATQFPPQERDALMHDLEEARKVEAQLRLQVADASDMVETATRERFAAEERQQELEHELEMAKAAAEDAAAAASDVLDHEPARNGFLAREVVEFLLDGATSGHAVSDFGAGELERLAAAKRYVEGDES